VRATRARFLVVIAASDPGRDGRRDGAFVACDGEAAKVYLDGNFHVDDVLDHAEEQPGPGIWAWEGWVWAYMSGYYEPECESGHHGEWRRATAVEVFRLLRGDAQVFTPDPNPPLYPFNDSHAENM
jgi:hypothetical protein